MTTRIFETKDDRKNLLVDDFRDIATNTWNLMANAYKSGMNISEETITEINLLDLKLKHPGNIFIKQIAKKIEGKTGADWLWAFVGKDENVFGMCVQAKRLFPDRTYKNIIEDKKNPTQQVNKLVSSGSSYKSFTGKKLYPLYIFYNTWNENYYQKTKGFPEKCCEKGQPHTILGCTYADAFEVKKKLLISKDSLDDYISISHPLSCLIACSINIDYTDLAKALAHRFVFLKNIDDDIDYPVFNQDDYLTTLDEAYYVKSVMLNEANDELLIQLGVKGAVVIKQD